MSEWRDAEGRIAARNAVVIRAAMRASVDPAQVVAGFLHTHPQPSENPTADRALARSWAKLNVRLDLDPLLSALQKTWSEGWVTGDRAASMLVGQAKARVKDGVSVDWASWRPGNTAAAALLDPPTGLHALLAKAHITIQGIADTTYQRIGTALADGIRVGATSQQMATAVGKVTGDPARALAIAVTEQNRAVSAATVANYRDAGLDRMEWDTTSGACDICAGNDQQVVAIGGTFNSGDDQPPAHTMCRCDLLPVVEE